MFMEFLNQEFVVAKITAAVFVPAGSGNPVHKNRPSHGLAFNVDYPSTYRFDDGNVLTCHAGECIYLPQGASYTVDKVASAGSFPPGAGVYAINFHISGPTEAPKPGIMQVRGKDEMLSAFIKAENAWRQKSVGFYEECFINLYRIVRELKQEAARYSPLGKALAILAPALEYINANYTSENISLSHLAALCGISEPYLRRLFRGAFSVPPAVYMRNMRIKYAKELLRSGEYSVTDAAILSGFNDTAYFSREFKKVTGVPPGRYHPY